MKSIGYQSKFRRSRTERTTAYCMAKKNGRTITYYSVDTFNYL